MGIERGDTDQPMTVPTARPITRDGKAAAGAREGGMSRLCGLGRRGAWEPRGEEGCRSRSGAWGRGS